MLAFTALYASVTAKQAEHAALAACSLAAAADSKAQRALAAANDALKQRQGTAV